MAKPRRSKVSVKDPFRTQHSSSRGRRVPHADKVSPDDPDQAGILVTLRRFELAGIEIDERAVEIATALTRWHRATADERRAAQIQERAAREEVQGARDSWVYYVRCGSLIKIGMTTNLKSRFASLRPNEVLAIEPGGSTLEASLHLRFKAMRVEGEYFAPGPDLQRHIVELRRRVGPAGWTRHVVPDGQNWFPDEKQRPELVDPETM